MVELTDLPLTAPSVEMIRTHVADVARELAELEIPAEREAVAVDAVASFEAVVGELPAGVAALTDAMSAAAPPIAAELLTVTALFARAPLADQARAALDALKRREPTAVADAAIGALRVESCLALRCGTDDVLVAVARRPGHDAEQLAILTVTSGVATNGVLTPPADEATRAAVISDLGAEFDSSPEALEPDALWQELTAALEAADRMRLGATPQLLCALPVLARALGVTPADVPRLPLARDPLPEQLDPPPDELEDTIDQLAEEFGLLGEISEAVERSGEATARAALRWKAMFGDRRLGRWTRRDVKTFLLDHAPRHLTLEEPALSDLPECLSAFFTYLDEAGHLEGDGGDRVSEQVERCCSDYARRMADPARWGSAKRVVLAMRSDGVDLEDADAIDRWVDEHGQLGATPLSTRASDRRPRGGNRHQRRRRR